MMSETFSINSKRISVNKSTAGQTTDPAQEKKLKKACADFEAILVFQLFKTMRQSVPKSGFLKHSQGQETYEMMMDQKISEEIARKEEGVGLQRALYNEISQHLQKSAKVFDGK
jgi:flagellar protein FlgJ